ncbi:hypothetical protein KKD19_03360 [Patescibacteria group bacterium]|nr:hypothetical protein [Patescibacteria group bacterium]MBU4512254.1 hypothetical protein [Patescibacteria group bacterium]MCG2692930.1 hypothetical protein [Candidatus Parcubacteria bacterium]
MKFRLARELEIRVGDIAILYNGGRYKVLNLNQEERTVRLGRPDTKEPIYGDPYLSKEEGWLSIEEVAWVEN